MGEIILRILMSRFYMCKVTSGVNFLLFKLKAFAEGSDYSLASILIHQPQLSPDCYLRGGARMCGEKRSRVSAVD